MHVHVCAARLHLQMYVKHSMAIFLVLIVKWVESQCNCMSLHSIVDGMHYLHICTAIMRCVAPVKHVTRHPHTVYNALIYPLKSIV